MKPDGEVQMGQIPTDGYRYKLIWVYLYCCVSAIRNNRVYVLRYQQYIVLFLGVIRRD